jgi:hypothetical protein
VDRVRGVLRVRRRAAEFRRNTDAARGRVTRFQLTEASCSRAARRGPGGGPAGKVSTIRRPCGTAWAGLGGAAVRADDLGRDGQAEAGTPGPPGFRPTTRC